jgi:hypothetical protein
LQIVDQPNNEISWVAFLPDPVQLLRFFTYRLHDLVRTNRALELLVVPYLFEEEAKLIEEQVVKGGL